MGKTYKNLIFTDHAYHRTQQRSIDLHSIYETIRSPDFVKNVSESKEKYFKTINHRKYQVIAVYKPEEKKYLIISTWVRGEDDKPSLVWQLISLPLKLLWWLMKYLLKILKNIW